MKEAAVPKLPQIKRSRRKDNPEARMSIGDHLRELRQRLFVSAAGVMVTASHNPAPDNGYKVYLGGSVVTGDGQGVQIVPPFDAEIAEAIKATPPADQVPMNDDLIEAVDPRDEYVAEAVKLASGDAAARARAPRPGGNPAGPRGPGGPAARW